MTVAVGRLHRNVATIKDFSRLDVSSLGVQLPLGVTLTAQDNFTRLFLNFPRPPSPLRFCRSTQSSGIGWAETRPELTDSPLFTKSGEVSVAVIVSLALRTSSSSDLRQLRVTMTWKSRTWIQRLRYRLPLSNAKRQYWRGKLLLRDLIVFGSEQPCSHSTLLYSYQLADATWAWK